MLNMIGCIDTPSSGKIIIDGTEVSGRSPDELADLRSRTISFVFQTFNLFPVLTAEENVEYPMLRRSDISKSERKERVAFFLNTVGLSKYAGHRPNQLSGGQRQRVAMGRAIVRQPQVFLFDEPLSNLDAKLRAQTRLEIQKLHRELGITSLFVTHDQVEAMTLAQRMIVMNAGRMEQFGTPEEVYSRPATTFVASFMGSPPMNLLQQAPGVREDRILGIRPEHIDIADSGWSVTVETVELLGAERLIHTRLGTEPLIIRLHEDQGAPAAGQTLKVRPREEKIHGFDRSTGARL